VKSRPSVLYGANFLNTMSIPSYPWYDPLGYSKLCCNLTADIHQRLFHHRYLSCADVWGVY